MKRISGAAVASLVLWVALISTGTAQSEKKSLTLEEIWYSSTFRQESVRGLRSMNDGEHYTSLDRDRGGAAINQYSYVTGEQVGTIVNQSALLPEGAEKPIDIASYAFSADESKLMIATEVEPIYRHSTREHNYIYDLKSKALQRLSEGPKQRYATFSPSGNRVAFVSDNDLYYTDLKSGKTTRITTDGEYNRIINGATDWVYEEEFGFDKAFFWAPDGSKIAYYRFDESAVREFSMPTYGELYPVEYKFKYPKAGEANATVSIHIYDLKKGTSQAVKMDDKFEYIPRIKWTQNSGLLSILRMPRHQNEVELQLVSAKTMEARPILKDVSETYIDITDDLTFLEDGRQFVWTSERDGYNHVYLYNLDGSMVRQITKGEWDVKQLLGIDQQQGFVYYMSAEDSPLERHLYRIKLDGSDKSKLTQRKGTNRAVFSKGFKYYINYQSDANTPSYVSLHAANGEQKRELVDNAHLKKLLGEYGLAPKQFFSFTTSQGVSLNGWMIQPPDFDAAKQYPVLMYVYGGPGSQTVVDSYGGNYLWHQYMASKGYLIVSVDNRGTGARGRDFKNCTYQQLGKLETEDQIEAAKYLASLAYVDPQRIGIWGWSYGGYMSSLCLTKGADHFKAAVAVAPVSNWRFYDTIYTERYMRTPQENADGYDNNSPINHVDKLEGSFLLVHGTGDDNVHHQNSVEMVNSLIKANKQFDFYIYPNRNHGIYGGNTRLHLFTKISDFLLENL